MKRHHETKRQEKQAGAEPDQTAPDAAAVPATESVTLSREEYEVLRKKEAEAEQTQARCARIQADFENTRRRLERDKQEFLKFANEEILAELVPFVDDFQRAFAAADTTQDFQVLHKGVEMILNHLLQLFKKYNVIAIDARGKKFDPQYHEALLQVETAEQPEDTVIEELQRGYVVNGRVLRTAKVKVAKAPEPEDRGPRDDRREEHGAEGAQG